MKKPSEKDTRQGVRTLTATAAAAAARSSLAVSTAARIKDKPGGGEGYEKTMLKKMNRWCVGNRNKSGGGAGQSGRSECEEYPRARIERARGRALAVEITQDGRNTFTCCQSGPREGETTSSTVEGPEEQRLASLVNTGNV